MTEKCEKCQYDIIDGSCICGNWHTYENPIKPDSAFEKSMMTYDHMYEQKKVNGPLTMDHHTGNCLVLFKGDYDLCVKVREFINSQDEK